MWPTVPNFAMFLLSFRGTFINQRTITTFGFQWNLAAGNDPAVNDLSSFFFASNDYLSLQSAFLACTPQNYTLDQAWLQMVFPTRVRKYVFVPALEGTIPVDAVQPNTQASVSRHAVVASRHGNGGVRVPAPQSAAYVVNGSITPAYTALLQTLANEMKEQIVPVIPGTTGTMNPVLLDFGQYPIVTARAIVATTVQSTARVIRRRTVGEGE